MVRRLPPINVIIAGVAFVATLGLGMSANTSVLAADGSGSSNQALLRGGYSVSADASCANAIYCDIDAPVQPSNRSVAAYPPAQAPAQHSIDCDTIDLSIAQDYGCAAPEPEAAYPTYQEAPAQHYERRSGPYMEPAPQFEADWQIALRGTYDWGTDGSRFGLSLTPQFSVTRQNSRGAIVVGGNANLIKEGDTDYRLSSTALDFNVDYAINRLTALQIGANLGLTQASSFGVAANAGTTREPIVVTGGANVALTRRSGRFTFAGRGSFNRTVYGATEIAGGTEDNSFRNLLALGAGTRIGYRVGGPIDVFVDAAVDRNSYDAASPTVGEKLDSWTFSGRVGATGNWGDVFLAEVSAGYGLRRFDSALLNDTPTALVDATLTYRPDGPVELSALFGTEISVPDTSTGASTAVTYTASANALYQVNDRWALRANLGGTWTRFEGSTETRAGVSTGVGADFIINRHTSLNADYAFDFSDSTTTGNRFNQQVAVGLTYSR